MALLTQEYSFTESYGSGITASQLAQNSTSNPVDGVRRMTIRQLLRASKMDDDSDAFMVDGHLFKQVILMANVHESTVHPVTSKITYSLDDGTGRIKGNMWPLEKGEPTFGLLQYAHVLGELEIFRGLKSLKISNIRPLFDGDGDEVFHHFLHAMFDTVVCEKGLPPPQQHLHRHNEEQDLSTRLNNVSLSETSTPRGTANASTSATLATPRRTVDTSTSAAPETPATSAELEGTSRSDRYLSLSSIARAFLQCVSNEEDDADDDLGVLAELLLEDVVNIFPLMTAEVFKDVVQSLQDGGFIVITTVGEDVYFKRNMD
ncbi:hypothetical protein D9619_005434 [Psilocybe cf. subviscida]|uniref:Replication protein A C-terminal domain-containing protein n=1 Tax=Psilocybe cf. subviscida TaxID=2480587 RepID=A0A8H5BX63_9AGAR|nr:hypothetical protein D9619_005434 [Psilocybe cf. subviscida]